MTSGGHWPLPTKDSGEALLNICSKHLWKTRVEYNPLLFFFPHVVEAGSASPARAASFFCVGCSKGLPKHTYTYLYPSLHVFFSPSDVALHFQAQLNLCCLTPKAWLRETGHCPRGVDKPWPSPKLLSPVQPQQAQVLLGGETTQLGKPCVGAARVPDGSSHLGKKRPELATGVGLTSTEVLLS